MSSIRLFFFWQNKIKNIDKNKNSLIRELKQGCLKKIIDSHVKNKNLKKNGKIF